MKTQRYFPQLPVAREAKTPVRADVDSVQNCFHRTNCTPHEIGFITCNITGNSINHMDATFKNECPNFSYGTPREVVLA